MTVNANLAVDVSILIVNWNSKDYLRACLTSIFRETHGVNFEVVVVDNASWDGTAEMLAAEFPQVKFLQSQENLGFARANNLAFEHSSGRVVLLLNPDTEVIGDAIPKMVAALESLKDAGIIGCKLLNTDLSVQTQCIKRFPMILREVLSIEWLRLKFPRWKLWSIDPLFSSSPAPVRVDALCGACQMISREVYQAVGGLNTKYFMYGEDIEVSAAALVKGWKTYYIGSAKIIHHGGKSSEGNGRGERWVSIMQREAHRQFYRAWRGTAYATFYRIAIGFVSLMRVFAMVLLSPALLVLRGKKDFLRVWRRWTAVLQWSLGFESLTREFRGQILEPHSVPNTAIPPAELTSVSGSTNQESAAYRRTNYALMTAAYNEEAHIEKTIQSVLSQTYLPTKWIIVSDGSSDRTDEIVQAYVNKHDFIHLLRVDRVPGHSFGSKVIALRRASKLLDDMAFDLVGNLDADVSVGPSYFEDLIARFDMDLKLGIAGGYVWDKRGERYQENGSNRVYAVAHAAQLVRRECYEAIGGYAVLKYGGEDWHAQVSAMMKGWTAQSFPDLHIFHHRPTGKAENLLRYKFREGRMDYSLGSDSLFEIFKCLKRIPEKPFFVAALARLVGFIWSSVLRENRPVSNEFVAFLRREQRERLGLLLRRKSVHTAGISTADQTELPIETNTFKRVVKLLISLGFFAVSWVGASSRRLVGKRVRGMCVVLCYHDISLGVRARFARQMDTLLSYAIPLPSNFNVPQLNGSRCVSVTFDDGLASFVENALPELEARNIPGTLFVVTGKLGQQSDWEHYWEHYSDRVNPIITSAQLREIADKVVIGSHSVTHPILTELREADAKQELRESRMALERILGRQVTLFSFPYGDFDGNSVRWCSEAGYERAFSTLPSTIYPDTEEFLIGRVPTEPTDWPLEFKLKLLGAYRWLPFAFAVKRKIVRFFNPSQKRPNASKRAPQQT